MLVNILITYQGGHAIPRTGEGIPLSGCSWHVLLCFVTLQGLLKMAHNLLNYLASAATVRADELVALRSLPATPLDDNQPDNLEDHILNSAISDADGFFRATSLTPTVTRCCFNSRCFLIFSASSRMRLFDGGHLVDANHKWAVGMRFS